MPYTAIFLHRNDLRPGKQFTLQLAERDSRFATFIPYEEANAIPFSTSELPSILFRYSIPPGFNEATEMANTLQICEKPPKVGEVKRCVTPLEAMVGFATMKLGMRDVMPVAMEGGGSHAAELWPYKVKAVRRVVVAGGKGAVSCHPQPYAYAVFSCHSTTDIEVYSVDLIAENDSAVMTKVVVVYHLDTTIWNLKHMALAVT